MRLRLALASARASAVGNDQDMLKAAKLSTLLARAERFEKPSFPLGGSDVMEAGVPVGPRVGELLRELESLWVERNFALDRAALAARLKDMIDQQA
jgi:poly(A) polymerase